MIRCASANRRKRSRSSDAERLEMAQQEHRLRTADRNLDLRHAIRPRHASTSSFSAGISAETWGGSTPQESINAT
jgi:hypothetical protein